MAKRIYVSNLTWRTSWQDLKDHFRQVGNGEDLSSHLLVYDHVDMYLRVS